MQQPPGRPGSNPQRPGGAPPGHVPGAPPPPGGYGRSPQPPPQYQQPPPPPPQYQQPQYAPPPPAGGPPAYVQPPKPRKSRVSLRFLAATCIFSGWFTLIVSILLATASVAAGVSAQRSAMSPSSGTQYFPRTPAQPEAGIDVDGINIPTSPGGGPLGGAGAAMGGMASMFESLKGPLYYMSAAVTLVSGIVSCLLFLGLGQVCYVLLDLEEQTFHITQVLQLLSSRLSR